MSPASWRQIEGLYQAAINCESAERAALLAQADPEVRRMVESLLDPPSPVGPPASQPAIGSQLGPYRIETLIGSGGMGSVYRAVDTRLDRAVAIKIPAQPFDARFEREGRSIAALNHPNICTVHDVGPNYLVMELIEGPTLAERIRKGPVPLEEALAIARQIAAALDTAHQRGLIHRDLKPANVKVKPDGTVKVLDFGLARFAITDPPGDDDPTHSLAVTQAGAILGTPHYMAPEQALGKSADKRADIWAFGVILYEMVTGARPFPGDVPVWDRVPAAIRPLLTRCLQKDPAHRLRDIGDAPFLLELPSAALPVTARSVAPWWILAATAFLLTAGAWTWSLFRPTTGAQPVLRLEITPPADSQFASSSNASGLSLSPDGRNAAYVVAAKGTTNLWVRALGDGTARMLDSTEGAALPFWSHDGKSIAFWAGGKLQRIDLAGGAPRTICETRLTVGGSWAPGGQILYGGWSSGLFQVDSSGGTPVPLTTPDAMRGEDFHYWPQVLPEGRFLYFARSSKPEYTGVYAASFAAPNKPVQLLHTLTNAVYAPGASDRKKGHLLWLQGSTLVAQAFDAAALRLSGEPRPVADPVASLGLHGQMVAAASDTGILLYRASNSQSQFVWYDPTGRLIAPFAEPAVFGQFSISTDGRRVATARAGSGGVDLWTVEVDRGVSTRLTSLPGISISPAWSSDGSAIFFASGSPFNLYRKDSIGAGPEQRLTQSPHPQFPTDCSLDGRWILYDEQVRNQSTIRVLPAAPATGDSRLYLKSSFNQGSAHFSPDGKWIAFQSDESGENEVYIASFPEPHGKLRVSTKGGRFPHWAAGGRRLFYLSADSTVTAMDVQLGPSSVNLSSPHPLFPVTVLDGGISPFIPTPDGKRILVVEPEKTARPLKVIVNWPALLK
uniref:Serine/threonine protein kinase n=1 Tax=Solibacter usitatus (strain Ellin6076) TaxID=234267 RepID=Q024X3_SOLUE